MRNVARIKLGYYPLPQEEGKRLRKLLNFSARTASVVDPCVGTGDALHQLTDGTETEKRGVELDANRVATAAASGIRTIHGDLFNAIGEKKMATTLKASSLPREFVFNGSRILDPDPNMSVDQVRDLLTPSYPEIVTATMTGTEDTGTSLRYSFSRAIGSKG